MVILKMTQSFLVGLLEPKKYDKNSNCFDYPSVKDKKPNCYEFSCNKAKDHLFCFFFAKILSVVSIDAAYYKCQNFFFFQRACPPCPPPFWPIHLMAALSVWQYCGSALLIEQISRLRSTIAEEKSWNVNQRWGEFAGRGQKAQISLAGGAIEGFCPDIVANQPFYPRHAFVWTPFRLAYPSNRHLLQTNSTLATNFEVLEAFLLVLTLIGQFAISHVVHKQKQGFICFNACSIGKVRSILNFKCQNLKVSYGFA